MCENLSVNHTSGQNHCLSENSPHSRIHVLVYVHPPHPLFVYPFIPLLFCPFVPHPQFVSVQPPYSSKMPRYKDQIHPPPQYSLFWAFILGMVIRSIAILSSKHMPNVSLMDLFFAKRRFQFFTRKHCHSFDLSILFSSFMAKYQSYIYLS